MNMAWAVPVPEPDLRGDGRAQRDMKRLADASLAIDGTLDHLGQDKSL